MYIHKGVEQNRANEFIEYLCELEIYYSNRNE